MNLCSWIFTRPDQAKQQVWIQQPGLNSMFTLVWAGGWIEWDPEVPFDLDDSVTTVFVRWYPKLTHSIKAKALESVEWRSHNICHVSEPCQFDVCLSCLAFFWRHEIIASNSNSPPFLFQNPSSNELFLYVPLFFFFLVNVLQELSEQFSLFFIYQMFA